MIEPNAKVVVGGQVGYVTAVRVRPAESLGACLLADESIMRAKGTHDDGELVMVYFPNTKGSTAAVDPSQLELHPDEQRLRAIEIACGLREPNGTPHQYTKLFGESK